MGKTSRRSDGSKSKASGKKEGNSDISNTSGQPARKGTSVWVSSLTWLMVVLLSLAFRFVTDRQSAKRELPRESDIFVVSYPKSGDANWYREIDFNSIEDVVPDLEYGPNRKNYHSHDKAIGAFKSHQPFAPAAVAGECATTVGNMEDYQCACPNCPPQWRRILHLVRDGRDVMCSYYHFRIGLGNLDPPDMRFEEFLKADIYPGFKWADHVNSYLDLGGNSTYDLLTVKYEDLHSEPFDTMVKVSKWAGLNHSEEVIRRAVSKSTFKSMRRKEEASGLRIFDDEYPGRDRAWRMTRKGKAGAWEECFSTPVSKDIWNELAYDTMYKLGNKENETGQSLETFTPFTLLP